MLQLGDHTGNKCTFMCFYVLSFIFYEVIKNPCSEVLPGETLPFGFYCITVIDRYLQKYTQTSQTCMHTKYRRCTHSKECMDKHTSWRNLGMLWILWLEAQWRTNHTSNLVIPTAANYKTIHTITEDAEIFFTYFSNLHNTINHLIDILRHLIYVLNLKITCHIYTSKKFHLTQLVQTVTPCRLGLPLPTHF